jgi:DNA invertase Pin-like site-specific DNA recombinase
MTAARRVGIYARVSRGGAGPREPAPGAALLCGRPGLDHPEYVDQVESGGKERRPALDALLAAVRARRVDLVACVKLDRLARSVHHLVAMVREFEVLGVDLVVLDQAIDTTTSAGRLLFHVLAAISEFERDSIRDRVLAGLRRARGPDSAGRGCWWTGPARSASWRAGSRCARWPGRWGSAWPRSRGPFRNPHSDPPG